MLQEQFVKVMRENSPLENETGEQYFLRLSKIVGLKAQYTKKKIGIILKRNKYPAGINGLRDFLSSDSSIIQDNTFEEKKGFSWRDSIKPLRSLQNQFSGARRSTNYPVIKIDTKKPICVVLLADLHAGSWGTDYDLFVQITDELINTPNLYAILAGDLLQMAIKMRNVKEVSDNALPPKWQLYFLDSWLKDVYQKVLFSTWGNHSVMREEAGSGFSMYAHIFEQYVPYSNGIAHADVQVGKELYKFAVSHFFKGNSIYTYTAGHKRYVRDHGHDREIVLAGHTHQPETSQYMISDKEKVALNCGSAQTNSGYAKRFYSLKTRPIFPCVVLHPKEHLVIPFWSVRHWLALQPN